MAGWTDKLSKQHICAYNQLNESQKQKLLSYLDITFPFDIYQQHKALRYRAFSNEKNSKKLLEGANQFYPEIIHPDMETSKKNLSRCGILLTAGGEGERLRLSLEKLGWNKESLKDFTKVTFPLHGLHDHFGTLQINLVMIRSIAKKMGFDIPVIITTGPEGSTTERVIQNLIKKHHGFGLKNLLVIAQKERLHLTREDQIAWYLKKDIPMPVTHPDETGGPLMRLKDRMSHMEMTPLEWFTKSGAEKILVLQATALYNPDILFAMASADNKYDCVGLGILRETFTSDDPYGTYVGIEKMGETSVIIIEQNIRNMQTMQLKNPQGTTYLPYNTGLYIFKKELLEKKSLPDFATPPKEILPNLERTPKVGYAATDLISIAHNPAIMVVPLNWFAVIKQADDLNKVVQLGKTYGFDKLCMEEGF